MYKTNRQGLVLHSFGIRRDMEANNMSSDGPERLSCTNCATLTRRLDVAERSIESLIATNNSLAHTIERMTTLMSTLMPISENINNDNNAGGVIPPPHSYSTSELCLPPQPTSMPTNSHSVRTGNITMALPPVLSPLSPSITLTAPASHSIYSASTLSRQNTPVSLPAVWLESNAFNPDEAGPSGSSGNRGIGPPPRVKVKAQRTGQTNKEGTQCILCGIFFNTKSIARHYRTKHPNYLGGQLINHPQYPLLFHFRTTTPKSVCPLHLRPERRLIDGVAGVDFKFLGYPSSGIRWISSSATQPSTPSSSSSSSSSN